MHPYSDDERANDATESGGVAALNRMVEDRLYWQERDPEFRDYVDASFKSVYGDNEAEQDATGRTISPGPRAATLPPFRPSATPEDAALAGGVGENQPNAWRDVLKVQKGLSSTRHYAFDMATERSGEHSPALAQAIRDFQREKKEEIDGILLPGGPTIARMKESLLGSGADTTSGSADNPVENIAQLLPKGLSNAAQGNVRETAAYARPLGKSGDPNLVEVRFGGRRPHQTQPPARSGTPSSEAGWFTLPTEKMPDDPNKWGNRAVIVKMPDERSYILRNPTPRERRIKDKSDFYLSPGTAAHRMPLEMAQARFSSAVPMTEDEAREERERTARGQGREPYPFRAHIPMWSNGGNGVYIRYYLPDGRYEDTLAWNAKTNERLHAAGGEPVFIAAEDALKLGLVDWMSTTPPNYTKAFPLPTFWRMKNPLTWASYLAKVAAYLEDQAAEGAKERFFGKAPPDAERTWR